MFRPTSTLLSGLGLAALALTGTTSVSRAADPVHIRGTVASVNGQAVTIKTTDDKTLGFTLGSDWKLAGVVPATLADIKQGTFIGTANMEGPDGNKALEVVVFPEALRGTGEGNYGWDLKPKSSMTNATVNNSVEGVDGRTVTLTYKGGEKKVTIPPTAPIVQVTTDVTAADVKPGSKVFVVGVLSDDGTKINNGGRLVVGKDGATPPM